MTLQSSQSGSSLQQQPNGARRQSISSKSVRSIGRYLLSGTTLGKGNFARVELASHSLTHAKVAIKIIETDKIKEDYVRRNLLREAQIMKRVRHPNVIRLYETMKANNLYCLVTEVAEGGELLSHVRNDYAERRLSEAQARPFVRQLISALHHLHTEGVVHRDLKMENILLDRKKRNIKIVDFGLSNSHEPGQLLATHCGSPEYAAPELFIPGRNYGPEVDVWSLGVNMYAMLCGKLPFRAPRQGPKRRQKLLQQISAGIGDSHEAEMSHLIPACADMIRLLLQPDPQNRPSLLEIMDHPWVTKHGLYALHPYRPLPPDQEARRKVIHLMTTYVDVTRAEIEECVGSNKCDWIAAVYNLLIDQPDGRNYLPQVTERMQQQQQHLLQSPTDTPFTSPVTSQGPMDIDDSMTTEKAEESKRRFLSHKHPGLVDRSTDSKFIRPRRTSLPPTLLSTANDSLKYGGPTSRLSTGEEAKYLSLRRHVSNPMAKAVEERARRYSLSPTHETPDPNIFGYSAKKQKSFRKKLTFSTGEPPSKRYSWALASGQATSSGGEMSTACSPPPPTSMKKNLSGGDVRGFLGGGKAPADIASLMSMPAPGVVLHRTSTIDESHTTSGSSNSTGGSGGGAAVASGTAFPRSPTARPQSLYRTQAAVLRAQFDDESRSAAAAGSGGGAAPTVSLGYRLRSLATPVARPQTVAMNSRRKETLYFDESDYSRQLPTIGQSSQRPLTSQTKSKSRTLGGILGRALRFKSGKSPTKS